MARDFDCLLHVGYMKTATTYLQNRIFNNNKIGFGIPLEGKGRAFIINEIVLSDGFSFDAQSVSRKLRDAALPLHEKNIVPVWSDETFLGEPVTRRYDAHSNAIRLHSVLPNAKVLITIREQIALSYSMYYEYLRQGGTASFKSFFGTGTEQLSMSPILRPEFLMYDRAVSFYHSLFGSDNVLVLPYEILRRDRREFFDRLSRFLSLDINIDDVQPSEVHKSIGATANITQYLFNRLKTPDNLSTKPSSWSKMVNVGIRSIDAVVPKSIDQLINKNQNDKIRARYGNIFVESNLKLSSLINEDLGRLGYKIT